MLTNTNWESINMCIKIILDFLLIFFSIMEMDYYSKNLLMKKKNLALKLVIDISILVILCYYYVTSKYINEGVLYFVLIATALLMITDTLYGLFNVKNKFMTMIYDIMIKTLALVYLPFKLKNVLLLKLYNVQIEKEDVPYLNMPLILTLMLQSMIFVFVISTSIETFCNKYFFAFALGTFVSYFSIDIFGNNVNRKNKSTNKYIFIIKKSFLIILIIELILIAFMANIDYNIISKLGIVKLLRLNEKSFKELFDSITLCTLVLQLIEYRNKLE